MKFAASNITSKVFSGRKIFGTDCHAMRMKTVALSTQVDVVNDDALPNIHRALRNNCQEPRPYATSDRRMSVISCDCFKHHDQPDDQEENLMLKGIGIDQVAENIAPGL